MSSIESAAAGTPTASSDVVTLSRADFDQVAVMVPDLAGRDVATLARSATWLR